VSDDNVVRLVPEDLDPLTTPGERPSVIKRIRDHHHLIARLVAEGKRTTDIAHEVGLSVSRVSILKSDPAFKQLVEMYRVNVEQTRDQNFATVEQQLTMLRNNALAELNERFEEDPEQFTKQELLELAEMGLDRTGYGKQSKNLSISGNLQDLSYLDERSAAGRRRDARLSAPLLDGVAEGTGGGSLPANSLPSPKKGET